MEFELSVFDDVFKPEAKGPVLKSLADTMDVALVLNPESKVWLLHDKYFDDIVMWAEYDIDDAKLSLIMKDGKIQELGMPVHLPMRKYLRQARQIFTVLLQDNKMVDSYVLPLMVRETGFKRV